MAYIRGVCKRYAPPTLKKLKSCNCIKNGKVVDPACGSSSLLMRAASLAPKEHPLQIYGQEKEPTTAGISRMNMVIHNFGTGKLWIGNTFSNPQNIDKQTGLLQKFDYVVVNPPFSVKTWTQNLVHTERFEGYGAMPPAKNGDFAWLMHVIFSLKPNGKAAVILPPGVLCRGNAEGLIRRSIICGDNGCLIKGVISFPPNIFMGTGIQAIALIIDKEDAKTRDSIFFIDAKDGFIQDGNKNRLREKDIEKIVTTFINKEVIEHYSANVPLKKIIEENECNLNITRYIKPIDNEISHDVMCHIKSGIPKKDIDDMQEYFSVFTKLKTKLFKKGDRKDTYLLNCEKEDLRNKIINDKEVIEFKKAINTIIDKFNECANKILIGVDKKTDVKSLKDELRLKMIDLFRDVKLIDKLEGYESFMTYFNEILSDDLNVVKYDGYEAGREIEYITINKKNNQWDGLLIPKSIIKEVYFKDVLDDIENRYEDINNVANDIQSLYDNAEEDSILYDLLKDENEKADEDNEELEQEDKKEKKELSIEEKISKLKFKNVKIFKENILNGYENEDIKELKKYLYDVLKGKKKKSEREAYLKQHKISKNLISVKINQTEIKNKISEIKLILANENQGEDINELNILLGKLNCKENKIKELNAIIKKLDEDTKNKYEQLKINEVKDLLINRKWLFNINKILSDKTNDLIQEFATNIINIIERYEISLDMLDKDLSKYEKQVNEYLKRMGYEL